MNRLLTVGIGIATVATMLSGCGANDTSTTSNNAAASPPPKPVTKLMTTAQLSKMMSDVNQALQYEYDTFSNSDGSRQWLSSDSQQFDIVNKAWNTITNDTPTGEATTTAKWKAQSDVRLTIDDAWNEMTNIQQFASGQTSKSDMVQYMQFYQQQYNSTLKELAAH